jgi:hypothetical protein
MKTTKASSGGTRKRSTATPAEGRQPPDPGDAELAPSTAPHYQTFSVRFLLDGRGCRRTEVTHVQLGASESWAGYDAERLTRWIAERVGPGPEAASPDPEPPVAQPATIIPTVRDLVLMVGGRTTAQNIPAGSPVTAHLALELGGPAEGGPAVRYRASVTARRLGGQHQLLGAVDGQAAPGNVIQIAVPAVAPQAGIYRLAASVAICEPSGGSQSLSGGLIQIYEEGEMA